MRSSAENKFDLNAATAALEGRSIALVGLMGAGKTSVGKRLAGALSLPFFDSDDEIEKAAGLCVSDIFSLYGEAEFRRVEKKVIDRLVSGSQVVLATGGGAYLAEETRDVLREKAVSVWLKADLETLWKRVCKRDTRPLLKTENPKQRLENLLNERGPVYAKADLTVESGDGPHQTAVNAVIHAIEGWHKS